jgi:hypothetical protein
MKTEDKKGQAVEPTKEQVLTFYQDQIQIATLRRDLAQLVAETAKYDAERVEANAKVAYFTNPPVKTNGDEAINGPANKVDTVDHVVTEDDLAANPDLEKHGVKVGDTVQVQKA